MSPASGPLSSSKCRGESSPDGRRRLSIYIVDLRLTLEFDAIINGDLRCQLPLGGKQYLKVAPEFNQARAQKDGGEWVNYTPEDKKMGRGSRGRETRERGGRGKRELGNRNSLLQEGKHLMKALTRQPFCKSLKIIKRFQ